MGHRHISETNIAYGAFIAKADEKLSPYAFGSDVSPAKDHANRANTNLVYLPNRATFPDVDEKDGTELGANAENIIELFGTK